MIGNRGPLLGVGDEVGEWAEFPEDNELFGDFFLGEACFVEFFFRAAPWVVFFDLGFCLEAADLEGFLALRSALALTLARVVDLGCAPVFLAEVFRAAAALFDCFFAVVGFFPADAFFLAAVLRVVFFFGMGAKRSRSMMALCQSKKSNFCRDWSNRTTLPGVKVEVGGCFHHCFVITQKFHTLAGLNLIGPDGLIDLFLQETD